MWYMTEEREMLKNMVAEFAEKEVRPFVKEMEEKGTFPAHLIKRAGELGILGLCYPEDVGGQGVDWINLSIAIEEIAKVSSCAALLIMMSAVGSTLSVYLVGTEEQKEKILKPVLRGETCLAMSICEPAGSSNYGGWQTKAVQDGDEWVLNGGKIFCTLTGQCDYYGILALTGEYNPATMEGVTLFFVHKDTPGFQTGHIEHKLAWGGSATGTLILNDVRVPKNMILGEVNKGLHAFGSTGMQTYAYLAVLSLGTAEGAYEKTAKYVKERVHTGGGTLFQNYEVVRHRLANMYMQVEACRSLLYNCMEQMSRGMNGLKECMAVKVFAQQVAESVASQAVELHGGNGLMVESDVERYYREAKMLAVGGFSVDIIREQLSWML